MEMNAHMLKRFRVCYNECLRNSQLSRVCALDSLDQSGTLACRAIGPHVLQPLSEASKTLGIGIGQGKHPRGSMRIDLLLLSSNALRGHQWLQESGFLLLGPEHHELITRLQAFHILHRGKLHFDVQSIFGF